MANSTALQEAAQALFCSLADYLGARETSVAFDKKLYKTYDEFMVQYTPKGNKNINEIMKEAYNKNVETPGVTLKDIEKFLSGDKTWFYSSMNIAKKMITEIDSISSKFSKIKSVNWTNVYYVRGDDDVMGNIFKMYSIANKKLIESVGKDKAFGDINKWSPADIYFASTKGKAILTRRATSARTNSITFDELNELISKLISDGELLPLSLKKQPGDVTIEKVNFDKSKGTVPYVFAGIGGAKKDNISLVVKISKTDQSKDLVFRHDASTSTNSGGTYKLEIRMKEARGGSLSGKKIIDAIMTVDKSFARKLDLILSNAKKDFADEFKKRTKGITKSSHPDRYRQIREEVSKKYFANKVNKEIEKYLIANERTGKSTKLVKAIMTAAASSSPLSGKYIIAK